MADNSFKGILTLMEALDTPTSTPNFEYEEEFIYDGRRYFCGANFTYKVEAVNHKYDPIRDLGRDYMCEVPAGFEEFVAYEIGPDEVERAVSAPSLIKALQNYVIDQVKDNEDYYRDGHWGPWM